MNKGLSEKVLQMAEKSPYPIEIKHANGTDTIIIGYNQQTGKYGISFTKDGENKNMKIGVSKDDMLSYMTNPSFEADLTRISREIEEKEEAYKALRKKLFAELDVESLPKEEKETVKAAIEYLTQVPDYTPTYPTIGVGSKQEGEKLLNQYIRVGNEFDRTQAIALQLVSRTTTPKGTDTEHRRMGLKDLIMFLKGDKEKETDRAVKIREE